jgi:hypothetical protein
LRKEIGKERIAIACGKVRLAMTDGSLDPFDEVEGDKEEFVPCADENENVRVVLV